MTATWLRPNSLRQGLSLFFALSLIAIGSAHAAKPAADASDDLADLSLEELGNLPVSTVSKTTQRANDAAAAVFVITQDDIRRSGATSIPEALRLVPGLQVAQINSNSWAISARGFNSRFANRLLVLMDGRTLYTLTFGGVFWDAQDTMIEDIERIEVVRGPGSALWGANAFNGVINIITKDAAQTGGIIASGHIGTGGRSHLGARFGESDGPVKWRVFGKSFAQGSNTNYLGTEGNDDWRQSRIGGRADIDFDGGTALRISAEAYRGSSGSDIWNYSSPSLATIAGRDEFSGAFGIVEWTATDDNLGRVAVRGVIDHTDRDSLIFDERRDTYDLEVQHNLPAIAQHHLMWGGSARHTADSTNRTTIAVVPADAELNTFSGFLQDDIAFFGDALHATVGAKVEHSDYIGTQLMPNLRLRYNVDEETVLWGAVSQGIRSASRLERDVRVSDAIPPLPPFSPGNPTPAPLGLEIWGDPNFAPERLRAFELGLRHRFHDRFSIDLATYYNEYSDMRGVQLLPPVCLPSGVAIAGNPLCIFTASKIVVPMQFTNLLSMNTWGAELTATWSPARQWRLIASYAYLNQRSDPNPVDFGFFTLDFAQLSTGLNARNQWTLRSNVSVGTRWDWDVTLRHVDALPTSEAPAYTEANTRIAWRPSIGFELALVGQNLLHADHREFVSDFVDLSPVSIKRSALLQARWSF